MNEYVLITGASSGIGREIAVNLSSHYKLILNGRNKDQLNVTKSLCLNSQDHLIFEFDIADLIGIEIALTSFIKEHQIYIFKLVHCAGYMKMLPIKMVNIDSLMLTYNTNVFSALFLIKYLSSKKVNNSSLNSVVFISSNISNFGAKAFSVYGSSKSALDGIMRNLAVELAPKVRLNSILPGAIKTQMTEQIFADNEKEKKMIEAYPLGLGKTVDVAELVEFLLSDKANWITGQQFIVDGGRSINISG